MKVAITKKIPDRAGKILNEAGFDVTQYAGDDVLQTESLIEFCQDADGIISLLNNQFNKRIIDQLNSCKVIANYAVGYNNIDVEHAKSKNIIVTNTPDVLTEATADLTIALMLACTRRINESDKFIREGKFKGWEPELLLGIQLNGKTFGLIGAGRIGQGAAKRAKAFGMKIIYHSRSQKEDFEFETGAEKKTLEEVLSQSDVISIHVPLTRETENLLNREKLDLLKSKAVLINTARGGIVDENYLIELLEDGKIFSAGLDVYQDEPKVNPGLLKLSNVVLLPHIGSATIEARNQMAELAAENVIAVLNGKPALTPV